MTKKTETKKTSANGKSPAQDSLPLFLKQPVPVEKKRHAEAGLNQKATFEFARDSNSIPLNIIEFAEAAKTYPIVFTADENNLPAAIVGLEQENYFVDSKGMWEQSAYIPAYVRKYPFAFMTVEGRDDMLLCVDEAAEHFAKKATKDTAFYEGGEPTALTKKALEFCGAYHNHYISTQDFCKALKENDLLVANQSDINLADGKKMRLGGFQLIDEKKFLKLSDKTVLEWHKKGWLAIAHFALMSVSNWRQLADRATVTAPKKAA